jgi:hypothetical protein
LENTVSALRVDHNGQLTTPEKRVGADGRVRSTRREVKREASNKPTTGKPKDKGSEPTPEQVDALSVKDKAETCTPTQEHKEQPPTLENQIGEVIATLDGPMAKQSSREERVCVIDKVAQWVEKQRDNLPPQQTTEKKKNRRDLSH